MDKLLSKETLELFLLYVVPGVVAQRVFSLLVAGLEQKLTDRAVEIISFSLVHVTVFFGLYEYVWGIQPSYAKHLAFVGLAVVLPAFEAALAVRAMKSKWLRRWIKTLHPTPKAWDYVFSLGRPYWVLLTLKNGTKIGGVYDSNSFASSFPNPEQIYVQQIWKLSETNEFTEPIGRSEGAIVPFSECLYVEFFEREGDHVGRQVATEERRLPAAQEGLPADGAVPAVATVATPEGR